MSTRLLYASITVLGSHFLVTLPGHTSWSHILVTLPGLGPGQAGFQQFSPTQHQSVHCSKMYVITGPHLACPLTSRRTFTFCSLTLEPEAPTRKPIGMPAGKVVRLVRNGHNVMHCHHPEFLILPILILPLPYHCYRVSRTHTLHPGPARMAHTVCKHTHTHSMEASRTALGTL